MEYVSCIYLPQREDKFNPYTCQSLRVPNRNWRYAVKARIDFWEKISQHLDYERVNRAVF